MVCGAVGRRIRRRVCRRKAAHIEPRPEPVARAPTAHRKPPPSAPGVPATAPDRLSCRPEFLVDWIVNRPPPTKRLTSFFQALRWRPGTLTRAAFMRRENIPPPQATRIAALTSALLSHAAGAAELAVVSGNGAKAAVTALMAQFERTSGHKIALHFEVNAALKRKIEAGEAFDVAVLNPPVVE